MSHRDLYAIAVLACGCGRIAFDSDAAHDDALPGDRESGAVDDAPFADAIGSSTAACTMPALFCDDFETGDLSRWVTAEVNGGGSIAVDGAIVHAGSFALDGNMPNPTPGTYAYAKQTFAPISTGFLALRAWIYAPQGLTGYAGPILIASPNTSHALLVSGDPSGLWTVSEEGGIVDHHSSTAVVVATWTCVELDYTFAAPATIDLYIADTNILSVAATDPAATFDRITIGLARAGGSSNLELVVDDLVLALAHIGCT